MARKTIQFPVSRTAIRSYKVKHEAKLCCQFCNHYSWNISTFQRHMKAKHKEHKDYPPHIVYVKAKDLTTAHHD